MTRLQKINGGLPYATPEQVARNVEIWNLQRAAGFKEEAEKAKSPAHKRQLMATSEHHQRMAREAIENFRMREPEGTK